MVHETTKRDPERIYLEPWPYSPEGRLWSEENVWPLYTWPPEPEGESERASGVEYIRSDLHDAEISRLSRELSAALERERMLREAILAELHGAGGIPVAEIGPDGVQRLWEVLVQTEARNA